MRIQNLYSYREADFNLYDYSVIAGSNASGKTNLLRILDFIRGEKTGYQINDIRLEKKYKPDPDKKSSVILELALSDPEATVLRHLIFKEDSGDTTVPEIFKKISVGLYWEETIEDGTQPIAVLRLGNGFSVIRYNADWMCIVGQLPTIDLRKKLEVSKDIAQSTNNDYREKFIRQHNFEPTTLFQQKLFRQKLLNGDSLNEFFTVDDTEVKMVSQIQDVTYRSPLQRWQKEIYDFTQMTSNPSSQLSLWSLLSKIIDQQIIIIKEIRPNYKELAKMLFDFNTVEGYEERGPLLSTSFSEIFPRVSYDVRQPAEVQQGVQKDRTPQIYINENASRYPIEESAAGYFEILYLLARIAHAKDSFLILDEPALHLHPTKIKHLGEGWA